jgi:hypothetical protein
MIGWYFDKGSLRWDEAEKCFIAMLRQFELKGPRALAHAADYSIAAMREEFTGEVAFVQLPVAVVTGKAMPSTPETKAARKGKV